MHVINSLSLMVLLIITLTTLVQSQRGAAPKRFARVELSNCTRDTDCSLNGICDTSTSSCTCDDGWHGNKCQYLNLRPLQSAPSGYGVDPNVTSWGGAIWREGDVYHLYATEETDGLGLSHWVTHSQIIHATSKTLLGPYLKKDVVTKPSTTNPQFAYDPKTKTFLLIFIHGGGGGGHQVMTSHSPNGPWIQAAQTVPNCNNPSPFFHPNGTLFLLCHNGQIKISRAISGSWNESYWTWTPLRQIFNSQGQHPDVPGNIEDPFLWIDKRGHFHALAHAYTCYWYPAKQGQCSEKNGEPCNGSVRPSAHAFSEDGEKWTWVGGEDAPYTFESALQSGGVVDHSTRERPWLYLDPVSKAPLALLNGVSPSFPQLKFVDKIDWTYTLIQGIDARV